MKSGSWQTGLTLLIRLKVYYVRYISFNHFLLVGHLPGYQKICGSSPMKRTIILYSKEDSVVKQDRIAQSVSRSKNKSDTGFCSFHGFCYSQFIYFTHFFMSDYKERDIYKDTFFIEKFSSYSFSSMLMSSILLFNSFPFDLWSNVCW
jgi:hypothetical protein